MLKISILNTDPDTEKSIPDSKIWCTMLDPVKVNKLGSLYCQKYFNQNNDVQK